jgi:WD40 repeat protein
MLLRLPFSALMLLTLGFFNPAFPASNDLSGFKPVPQFGHSYAPFAVAIAPNAKWIATATLSEIYLWDMETGTILRQFDPPFGGQLWDLAISVDSSTIYARSSKDAIFAWKAETGEKIDTTGHPLPTDLTWIHIERFFDADHLLQLFDDKARQFLAEQKVGDLIDLKAVQSVFGLRKDAVEVITFADDNEDFAFIDLVKKRLITKFSVHSIPEFCGAFAAFAFNDQVLAFAPTDLDASHDFTNLVVVDIEKSLPVLRWKHFCQNFMFSAEMFMKEGLIVSSARPDKLTIWNPQNAQPYLQLDNVYDSGGALAISHDRKTFAVGSFREQASIEHGVSSEEYGVTVQRDGKKRFIGFGSNEVKSVRLSADSKTLYILTGDGWSSWDIATSKKLLDKAQPPEPEETFDGVPAQVLSPDGEFRIVNSTVGNPAPFLSQVIEVATRRVVLASDSTFHFVDANHVWSPAPHHDQSVILWNIRTGQQVWTATDKESNALVMEFPDGHVRISKGAEDLVKLVRGFEIRSFDKLAKETFLER